MNLHVTVRRMNNKITRCCWLLTISWVYPWREDLEADNPDIFDFCFEQDNEKKAVVERHKTGTI